MSSKDKHAVILIPKGWKEYLITEIRHPRTQKGHLYAFNGDKTCLCEVVCVNDPHSAWFIGNTIESDGRLQMLTPMDPLLLAIPYLRAAERSVPLDDLLIDDDFTSIQDIIGLLTREKLEKIALPKGPADLNVWQWNEEKALEYLATKINKLKTEIKEKGLSTLDNESSTNYVSAKRKEESQEEEECLRYAWEFLSDFLSNDLSEKLAKHVKLNLNTPALMKPVAKKPKLDGNVKKENSTGPVDDFSKDNKPTKIKAEPTSAKGKALAKSAKGSKSISSFFGKSPK